mgnify:CR=1 FL=1
MEEWNNYLLENVNCEGLQKYEAFKVFLETGRVEKNDDCYIEIKKNTVREEDDTDYDPEDDDEEAPYSLVYLEDGEYHEEEIEIEEWQHDKQKRLRVVTGDLPHPNGYVQDILEGFFHQHYHYTNLIKSNINLHYSDLAENEVAINIKCHETFAHEGLLEHGIISWETEEEHRSFALESFMEDLPHREETKSLNVVSYGLQGKSGGYLVLTLEELLFEPIQWILDNVDRLAQEHAKHYQDIAGYEWCKDDMEDKIQTWEEEKEALDGMGVDVNDLESKISEMNGYLNELKQTVTV